MRRLLDLGVILGIVLALGCNEWTAPQEEFVTREPRSAVLGWVENLPGPLAPNGPGLPRTDFGCALREECKVGGLTFTVTDYGDTMVFFRFGPSVFCGQTTVPVEHQSQRDKVQIALTWNHAREAYTSRDTLSASAPAAAECWAGGSAIFTVHYEVVREVDPTIITFTRKPRS